MHQSPRWVWIAWLGVIVLGSFLLLWETRRDIGLTWDEPAYIRAAMSYTEWQSRLRDEGTGLLQPAVVRAYWEVNHEHPPMVKLWLGWTASVLPDAVNFVDRYRFGAMLLSAILIGVVAWGVARETAPWIAGVTALVLLSMPRFFFHAHVAALDVPGALAYTTVIFAFWWLRSQKTWWWDIVLGIVFGIALATKINAAFALPVLGLWWIVQSREWRLLWRLVVMTVLGCGVFVAAWPWLWIDLQAHLLEYLAWLTVSHWQIPQWWLGQSLLPPPWYFAPLMALMVTPVAISLSALLGGIWSIREPSLRAFGVLMLLAMIMPLIALMMSQTVYDNDRLFMPFFPFVAVLVGIAVWRASMWLRERQVQHWSSIIAVCVALIVANPIAATVRLWPHGLSYYSETIGGLAGAQRLRLDHTYWNETYAEAIAYIDAQATPGATVWIEAWSQDVPHTYQRAGMIRSDVVYVSTAGSSIWGKSMPLTDLVDADYAIVTYRFAGWSAPVWALVAGNSQPVFTIARDGVILLEVYRMP